MCILFLPGGACAEIPLLRHPRPAGAQVEHWTFQDRELPYAKISIPVRSLSRLRCCIFWLFSRSTKILNFLIRPISACQVDEGMVALAADGFHSCQALYQQELQNLKRSITSRLIKLHFISWNRTKILFSIYLSLTFKQLGEIWGWKSWSSREWCRWSAGCHLLPLCSPLSYPRLALPMAWRTSWWP